MAVQANLPASGSAMIERPIDQGNGLASQFEELQLVIEAQSSMLDALTKAQPSFDSEVLKTMAVFQKNAEKGQELFQTVIEESKSVKVQLAASEAHREEDKKLHAAEKEELKKLIDELRVQNAASNAKFLQIEADVHQLKLKQDALEVKNANLEKRHAGHTHASLFSGSTTQSSWERTSGPSC